MKLAEMRKEIETEIKDMARRTDGLIMALEGLTQAGDPPTEVRTLAGMTATSTKATSGDRAAAKAARAKAARREAKPDVPCDLCGKVSKGNTGAAAHRRTRHPAEWASEREAAATGESITIDAASSEVTV
jgi:hypothetical protein